MTRAHRDPTGLTSHAAAKLARQRLFADGYYAKDVIIARSYRCSGQAQFAGRKTTSGCHGPDHLQPCPGGPVVYEIVRQYGAAGMFFNMIETRGDSWLDAIERLERRRAADRERYGKIAVRQTRTRRSR